VENMDGSPSRGSCGLKADAFNTKRLSKTCPDIE
jgi:hypothetical protein